MKRALVVMAKYPAPGEAKTRLSPPLSPEDAASLYERFLIHVLRVARSAPSVARFVAYAPVERDGYFREIAPDFDPMPQNGNGLGERLDNTLRTLLNRGFDAVIALGSDVPTLPARHLTAAFDLLEAADVVLGPCEDGGYYLIGTKSPQPRLLREVRMSTTTVLQDTLAIAAQEGLKVSLAPEWYDVDTVEDLARIEVDRLLRSPKQRFPSTRGAPAKHLREVR